MDKMVRNAKHDEANVISIFRGQADAPKLPAAWSYELLTLSDCSRTLWRRVIGLDTPPQKLLDDKWVTDTDTLSYLEERSDARSIYKYGNPSHLPDSMRQLALRACEEDLAGSAASR